MHYNKNISIAMCGKKEKEANGYFLINNTFAISLFKPYAFVLLTSTIILAINYFVVITHPLNQLQTRNRSSSSCYMIETHNTHHRFPCY